MQNLTKYLHKALIKENKTLAIAESSTAGLISKILTDNPGSSKYLLLGITAYSNQIKNKILKIPASILSKNGAVSEETALLMAKNVRKLAKADLGLAVTGIAGPTGARINKPVGTAFIAVTDGKRNLCQRFLFKGDRSSVRKQTALQSLQLLKSIL
ncbi:MAG: CinA family protein [Candidatus Omnitrophica bacterium]|jgi:PncC family amidohydrolase|nr:CinA family protein [Candidatus Omnitrophota bacterium]MDD3987391.1 CinA family protein [Candidatus Omnitrophota bacterium]MDD4981335.1 CinA family protein [Candidatus Omnitrophota bacterium]MDD5664622.1 CinA family protein [Candidatus Omnitrophota bacterium]